MRWLGCLGGGLEGRADGAELDLGEGHRGIAGGALNLLGVTGVGLAGATANTGLAGLGILGVGAVEPHHAGVVVIPDAHDQDHGLQGVAHALKATVLSEVVIVAEGGLLGRAELGGDGVALDALNVGLGVGDNLVVLDPEALNLGELALVGAVGGDELGHDGHRGLGVDGVAGAVEGFVAHAEGVEVASVGVASAGVAGLGVGAAALVALAHSLLNSVARVGSIGRGDAVGLPDVHLGAAGAVATDTGILVALRGHPAFHVGLCLRRSASLPSDDGL